MQANKIKVYYLSVLILLLLVQCGQEQPEKNNQNDLSQTGGKLTFIKGNIKITTLPMAASDEESSFVIWQIYDRLFKLKSNSNSAIPHLVQNYVVTNDGKTYTFELKKGVYFQDDPCYPNGKGKELTSKDVKFTVELLCTKSQNNHNFDYTLRDLIAGANDFYDNSNKKIEQELSGLKIIDKYKFSIDIESSTPKLLQILASHALSIISKEAYTKYGVNIKNGTGAFKLDPSSKKKRTVLVKNTNYFMRDSSGAKLPYLDTIEVLRIDDMNERLKLFKRGAADIVTNIAPNEIKQIIEEEIKFFENTKDKAKYIVDFDPDHSTRLFLFNLNKKPYNNKAFRKALNYGLDKEKILALTGIELTSGAAYNSFVPPVMSNMGYIRPENISYKYNLTLAKKYLADAGYPDGKNLAPLHLIIPQQEDAIKLAIEIQKQLLQKLNIKMEFEILDANKNLELVINNGDYEMINFYWIADFLSPESFLNLFYNKNNNTSNIGNYNNVNYNLYFNKAIEANNFDSTMHYFNAAENILMDDIPMIMLYYGSSFRLMQNRISNLENPILGTYDLSKVKVSIKK